MLEKQRDMLSADDPRLIETVVLLTAALVEQGDCDQATPFLEEVLSYDFDAISVRQIALSEKLTALARQLTNMGRERSGSASTGL